MVHERHGRAIFCVVLQLFVEWANKNLRIQEIGAPTLFTLLRDDQMVRGCSGRHPAKNKHA